MAMELSGHHIPPEEIPESTLDERIAEIHTVSKPTVFRLMAWGHHPESGHKIFNLGSCPVNEEIDGSKLLYDSSFWKEMLQKLETKYPGTKLLSMVVTYGRKEKTQTWSRVYDDFDDEKKWEEFFKSKGKES
jgi:hypothetical protein